MGCWKLNSGPLEELHICTALYVLLNSTICTIEISGSNIGRRNIPKHILLILSCLFIYLCQKRRCISWAGVTGDCERPGVDAGN